MGKQVAFFLLVLAPVLLIVVPLAVAYRKDSKAKAARSGAGPRPPA